jgi:hypothetical protein
MITCNSEHVQADAIHLPNRSHHSFTLSSTFSESLMIVCNRSDALEELITVTLRRSLYTNNKVSTFI